MACCLIMIHHKSLAIIVYRYSRESSIFLMAIWLKNFFFLQIYTVPSILGYTDDTGLKMNLEILQNTWKMIIPLLSRILDARHRKFIGFNWPINFNNRVPAWHLRYEHFFKIYSPYNLFDRFLETNCEKIM